MIIIKNLIDNLYKAYDQLNQQLFNSELPDIIITIQSNSQLPKNKRNITGYTQNTPLWEVTINGHKQAKYEITLIAEFLNRTYEEIIETLLHEMCHLHNTINRIDDCSKRGKHNEHFRDECERINLLCEQASKTGWSDTHLSEHLLEVVHNLDINHEAFKLYRITIPPTEHKTRVVKPIYIYRCPCCNKEVKSKDDNMIIVCGNCKQEFEKIEK